ncbi:MAG: hypothetical protein A2097_11280 [Desulfobacula sp. GWF2_41_7]|nr:MAG: hypothetical protein A2097_11280 [Desulfobacula sp. GWF2_41_7]
MGGNGLKVRLKHGLPEDLLSLVSEGPYMSSDKIPQIAAYLGVHENRIARALGLLVGRRQLNETRLSDGSIHYSVPCRTVVYMEDR